ncbi:hypothetical protein BDW75DRAFT_204767, partial [Aspergillus navahoensis]
MRWQTWPFQAGNTTKYAISNGGLFQLAARLGRYTANETYIRWAEGIGIGVSPRRCSSLMIGQLLIRRVWRTTARTMGTSSGRVIKALILLGLSTCTTLPTVPRNGERTRRLTRNIL